MSVIVNERDKIMQTAPLRIVPVEPAEQIVVPGYTGIKLVSDVGIWNAAPTSSLYRIQPGIAGMVRETLTVQFTGITSNTTVFWEIGNYAMAWDEAKQQNVVTFFTTTPVSDHGILLTPGPTPNVVRTIEMTSYPRSQPFPGNSGTFKGGVRISCVWAAQTFSSVKGIVQH